WCVVAARVGFVVWRGVVAFWKPWASNGSNTAATTVATAANPATTVAGKPANGSQLGPTGSAPSTPTAGKPGAAAGADKPVPAPVDSAQSEQIVAAVRADLPFAKLAL